MTRWRKVAVFLLGALLLSACVEDPEVQTPGPPEPCAAVRADLSALADADKDFTDIPAGTDQKTIQYFIHAAKLAKLQRELRVEEMVIGDFASMEEAPLFYGNSGASKDLATAEKAWAETQKKDILDRIEVVLKASDDNGLTLRDGKGSSVDAGRIMTATFFREVSAKAKTLLSTCDTASPDIAQIQSFIDEIHVIQTGDAHGLIERGRADLYLSMEAP